MLSVPLHAVSYLFYFRISRGMSITLDDFVAAAEKFGLGRAECELCFADTQGVCNIENRLQIRPKAKAAERCVGPAPLGGPPQQLIHQGALSQQDSKKAPQGEWVDGVVMCYNDCRSSPSGSGLHPKACPL